MEWKELQTLVKRKIGYGIVQPGPSVQKGVPIIKVNNIISGLYDTKHLDKTTVENDAKYQRTKLKGGELIVTVVGTCGKTAIVPPQFVGCNLVRATCLIDIEDETICRWIKYYIDSPQGQAYINRNLNTTVQATLNVKNLNEMPIPFYSKEYTSNVVKILSSLDRKIELNNKINADLEEMAQAIFKNWFVDFEPFKDSKFVDSELGMIPEGWKVGTLEDIAEITMGQSPAGNSLNENREGMIFYQGSSDFGFRFPSIRVFTTEPKRLAVANSVLFSVRAPVGDINVAKEVCCIGRGVASIKSKYGHDSYLFYAMKSLHKLFDSFDGEGTVFGSINKKTLSAIQILLPSDGIVEQFNNIASSFDDRIRSLSDENSRLSLLRDTLLPRLMSGELEVPE